MRNLILFSLLITSIITNAQVGIGTSEPTATLDVNGSLRLRTIQQEMNMEIAADSILVISRNGHVNRVASKTVLESALRTAVKGSFSGSSVVTVSLASSVADLPFDQEEFDLNDEYDTTTYTFTAKQDGIYDVYSQIKASPGISITTNYGISILKNGVVEAQTSYANIGVVGINITPPVRSAQTLLQLNAGDTIKFELQYDIATVDLLESNGDSFFTIHQIR